MSSSKSSILTRFKRLFRMASWLWRAGYELRHIRSEQDRKQALINLGYGCLNTLDIQLDVHSEMDKRQTDGILVVSNHISWLDIFAISALYPSSFIAKNEIHGWPILGKMGEKAGTIFINRNDRKAINPTNLAITKALQQGYNVSFFPEAMTTLGNEVMPFKSSLFQAAIDGQAKIQPLALRYYDHKNQRTTIPSYAGNMNLFKSLWLIVSMPQMRIRVDCCKPIEFGELEGQSRFTIKNIAEDLIRQKVMQDSPLNK